MVDVLHCVDMGLNSHIVGNVIWWFVVVCSCFGGGTQLDKLQRMHNDLKKWYSHTKCKNRIRGQINVERVRASAGDWPKLKGKAAALRCLAPYALDLARRFCQLGSVDPYVKAHDTLVLGVTQLMVNFYDILSESSQFAARCRDELPLVGNQLMLMYAQL